MLKKSERAASASASVDSVDGRIRTSHGDHSMIIILKSCIRNRKHSFVILAILYFSSNDADKAIFLSLSHHTRA